VSRKDKSLGDTFNGYLLGFCFMEKNKIGGALWMNAHWIKVVVAAVFEVFWVIGLILITKAMFSQTSDQMVNKNI